ncbi:hypothetical protein PKCEKB_PKCEKB_02345, partial [Dysosmobacter welbionis]
DYSAGPPGFAGHHGEKADAPGTQNDHILPQCH